METTPPAPRSWRRASYTVEAVLLIVIVAIAMVEVAGVYSIFFLHADHQADRCTHPKSAEDSAGAVGVAALIVAVAVAGTSLRRVTRGRPNVVWALLASIGAGTIFLFWTLIVIAVGSC
ncbi:MAG: hypothetical protein JWR85_3396 [Marmoricola sp.]|jgi:hypothetical protein|nr:hypothetical protein [Marmoricola sp.]